MLSLKMRGSGDEILIRDSVEMNKDIDIPCRPCFLPSYKSSRLLFSTNVPQIGASLI